MRLSVQRVLEVLAENPRREDLRRDYPELEDEDIRQALGFAAAALSDRIVPIDVPLGVPTQRGPFPLRAGGAKPSLPGPDDSGPDPTDDSLTDCAYDRC